MSPKFESASTPAGVPCDSARPAYSRIVVKAGTSLLTRGTGRLNPEVMQSLVTQIARLHLDGVEVILVSSGAVAAGRHLLRLSSENKHLSHRQALAAVGQSHLMHVYGQLFDRHEIVVAQALLSRRDIDYRLGYLNARNTLLALLEHKVIPIINENDVVAVEELAGDVFGDNDTLSALVANLVDADLLAILGEIEGLFTADPNLDPSACLIPVVERVSQGVESMGGPSWRDRGRGGMVTKLESARMAAASGVNVAIACGFERDVLTRLSTGERVGTFFPATNTKMESRKRWMLSEASAKGEVVVDNGAVEALCRRNGSLLPAGMTEVEGPFERGEIISILNSHGVQIACGITNYSSADLMKVRGAHSERIVALLGHEYGEEVIHRNNLVIL